MTCHELYLRITLRHRAVTRRFSEAMLKVWLDELVNRGHLELEGDRYYLTDTGLDLAEQLDSRLPSSDNLEESA